MAKLAPKMGEYKLKWIPINYYDIKQNMRMSKCKGLTQKLLHYNNKTRQNDYCYLHQPMPILPLEMIRTILLFASDNTIHNFRLLCKTVILDEFFFQTLCESWNLSIKDGQNLPLGRFKYWENIYRFCLKYTHLNIKMDCHKTFNAESGRFFSGKTKKVFERTPLLSLQIIAYWTSKSLYSCTVVQFQRFSKIEHNTIFYNIHATMNGDLKKRSNMPLNCTAGRSLREAALMLQTNLLCEASLCVREV